MSTTFDCPSCKTKNERRGPEVGCAACGFGRPHQHEQKATPMAPPSQEAAPPAGYKGKLLTEQL